MKVDRRLFLLTLSAPLYPTAPLTVLTADEAKAVEALCAQIIPAHEWPGANEAGVLYYIDKQLAGTLARFSGEYKKGISALNSASREQTGRLFTELRFAEQKHFLQGIEAARDSELNRFFQRRLTTRCRAFTAAPYAAATKGKQAERCWGLPT